MSVRRRIWLREVVIIAIGYWLYSIVRSSVPTKVPDAVSRGDSILSLERQLGLPAETTLNAFVAAHKVIAYVANYYYSILHFLVTIGVAIWVLRRHPTYARGLRIAWYGMNVLALTGFAFFALAPPRLLPGGQFVDTVVTFHTWGSWGTDSVATHSNQYAAMPSMHIGWSLWVAITVAWLARRWWVRVLAVLYPLTTLFVIVGTANHYFLDALGGALACGGGFLIARLITRRRVLPRRPLAVAPVPDWHEPLVPLQAATAQEEDEPDRVAA